MARHIRWTDTNLDRRTTSTKPYATLIRDLLLTIENSRTNFHERINEIEREYEQKLTELREKYEKEFELLKQAHE